MSGRPALNSDTSPPRLLVVERRSREVHREVQREVQDESGSREARDGDSLLEVFEVVAVTDGIVRTRSAYLFELGEELAVRIEHAGSVTDAIARVRGHAGPAEDRITELEISDRSAPRAG